MTARESTPKGPLWVAYGLAASGGAILFLGWAGFGLWPLELVALVPLWYALELVGERSWRSAVGVGWLYGTVGFVGGYHWMLEFSQRFSSFGLFVNVIMFGAFSTYLGLQFALLGALYRAIRARGWSVTTAALSTLIVTEWLFPRWFPTYVANALLQQPLLVQTADLGGPLLVSTLVGAINVAVFETIRWSQGARSVPVAVIVATLGFVTLSLVYGIARIERIEADIQAAPSIEVGLVQVNMGVFEKRQQMLEAHERHLEQSADLEHDGPLDLLVWPESAYNYPRFDRMLPFIAKEVRQDLQSPILFGALSVTYEAGYRQLYNSVYLTDPDGLVGQRYDKTRLAMFGEYLPLGDRFPVLYRLSPNSGWFTPGSHVDPLSFGPWRISTPVCYEDILPSLIREMVSHGNPHLLVNLTNDAWFGNTQEPWIHLRLSQFRAIEHRRYLVRATNSGVSAIIDPVGRIVAHTEVGTRANLRGTVHMMEGRTLYGRLGDWPGWMSLAVVGLTLARRRQHAA